MDDATLQILRKNLPPGKNFRSKQGEVVLNNVNTTTLTTATAMVEDHVLYQVIHVLIDTGCLQTNIINTRVADLLNADGGTLYKTDIILTAGVGGRSYGVQGVSELDHHVNES